MDTRMLVAFAAALPLALAACGSEPGAPTEGAPPEAASAPISVSGTYEVTGETVEKESGRSRQLSGLVILAQEGDDYTSTFELETLYPTSDGPTEAQLIGSGKGRVEGATLTGSAETQILFSEVPGVDAGFAFLPRSYGPRIVSRSTATVKPDGRVEIEIETSGAVGERYAPTHTTLRGRRMEPEALE